MQPSNIALIGYFRDMIAINKSRTRFSCHDLPWGPLTHWLGELGDMGKIRLIVVIDNL